MLNTYIYHQLPPIYSCICYTIFREIIALFAQKLYAFSMLLGGGGLMFRRKKDHLIMVMTKRHC